MGDIDSNKADLKKRYLEQCAFPGEHYSVRTSPYKDQEYLSTSLSSVETEISLAKAAVEAEGTTKKDDKKTAEKTAVAATATAATVAALQQKKDLQDSVKADAQKVPGVPNGTGADKSGPTADMATRLAAATVGANGPNAPGGANSAPGNPINSPAGPEGQSTAKSKPGLKPKTGDSVKVKEALMKNMAKFGIRSVNQQAALLGNVEHESGFQPIAENLNYKPATLMKLWPNRFPNQQVAQETAAKGPQGIANTIYGGRMGNTDANDGWDYRGRGPFQLTGKSNYAAISKVLNKDIVSDPDKLITDPEVSANSALAYWASNPKLGKLADAGQFGQVRQMVNGGSIGAEEANKMVMEYLDKLKSGELKIDGSASGPGGTSAPGLPVSSPKPVGYNPGGSGDVSSPVSSPKPYAPDGVAQNANTGPVPAAYAPASQMTSSPRPSYDPSSGSAAAAPTSRAPAVDPYYTKKSAENTGDNINFMKETAGNAKQAVDHLKTIVDLLTKLPESTATSLAALIGMDTKDATAVASAEPTKASTPAAGMPKPSLAFKRSLAGN